MTAMLTRTIIALLFAFVGAAGCAAPQADCDEETRECPAAVEGKGGGDY